VIGCPAGGVGRGGPVCGIGGGAWGGAGVLIELPGSVDGGDAEGNPEPGAVGWLVGSPVRGSMVDGTPVGWPPAPVWASAGAQASTNPTPATAIERAYVIASSPFWRGVVPTAFRARRVPMRRQRPSCARKNEPTAAL
jgi:hypothetical protein